MCRGPRPLGRRLLEANLMCKLSTRSFSLCKILWCLQKRKGNTWGETQEECVIPGSMENCRNLHGGKTAMPLLHRGWIQPIKTANIKHSWRNWSSWKQMIGQSFRSTWKKNYTWPNFTMHQLSNRLGIGRDPM